MSRVAGRLRTILATTSALSPISLAIAEVVTNRSALLARCRTLGSPITILVTIRVRILGELGKYTSKIAVTVFQDILGIDLVDTQRQKDCRLDVSVSLLERACRLR